MWKSLWCCHWQYSVGYISSLSPLSSWDSGARLYHAAQDITYSSYTNFTTSSFGYWNPDLFAGCLAYGMHTRMHPCINNMHIKIKANTEMMTSSDLHFRKKWISLLEHSTFLFSTGSCQKHLCNCKCMGEIVMQTTNTRCKRKKDTNKQLLSR